MTFPFPRRQASKQTTTKFRATVKGVVGREGYAHMRDTIRQAFSRNVAHGARWLIYVAITLVIIEATGWLLRQFGAPATVVGRWVSYIEIGFAIAGAFGFLVEVLFDLAESVTRRIKKISRIWHGDDDRSGDRHRRQSWQTSKQGRNFPFRGRRTRPRRR